MPPLPKTLPEPLSEEQIRKVLSVSLDNTLERLRNFPLIMSFLETGLRLSRVDLAQGEMTILGKGNKER